MNYHVTCLLSLSLSVCITLGINALEGSGYSVCWIYTMQWNLTGMVEWLTSNSVARVSPGCKVPLSFCFTVLI